MLNRDYEIMMRKHAEEDLRRNHKSNQLLYIAGRGDSRLVDTDVARLIDLANNRKEFAGVEKLNVYFGYRDATGEVGIHGIHDTYELCNKWGKLA